MHKEKVQQRYEEFRNTAQNNVFIYFFLYIFVVPCIVILGWRNPTRCNTHVWASLLPR